MTLTQRVRQADRYTYDAAHTQTLIGIKARLKMLTDEDAMPAGKTKDEIRAGIDHDLKILEDLQVCEDFRGHGQAD